MKNSLGIEIPEYIEGLGKLEPFQGAWKKLEKGWMTEPAYPPVLKAKVAHHDKVCNSLEEALEKEDIHDGMTVSFHHHLRSGDGILVKTLNALHKRGIKDITLASSSLTSAHEPILPYLQDGTVTRIWTSGARGKIGEAISRGVLPNPVVIHSHGGRVRAIKTGKIRIDLVVVAASAADKEGNATGTHGPSAFGSMGYAVPDCSYAKHVVVVTDNLVEYPCIPISVRQSFVDYVAKVDSIGDPTKIATGTTRITKSPMDLRIAQLAAQAIEHSGYLEQDFSFQVGAGGASLAVAKFVREIMKRKGLVGSFALGGVTSYIIEMLNEKLFKTVFDVQSFDAEVASSIFNNKRHIELTSGLYANPFNCGCMTNMLDIVVLGALEVDVDFNVNVITGSDGCVRGASGGHSDTASGAKLTVVVCPSFRGRIPIIKKKVLNVVTPGESVDLVVTERGVCVNPNHKGLEEKLRKAGIKIKNIHDLEREVEGITGPPKPIKFTDKTVGLIEYRDGTIIDVIKQVDHS
ncbi:MAG: citrate lyase subunit alpha [bacterium]|nr:citrate lyase subunit alpha [bacterium]